MIRGNLATRPFYDERPVRVALVVLVLTVVAATAFNLTQALGSARTDSAIETAAAQDESRARDLAAAAVQLRATVDPKEVTAAADRARQANDLIDRRTFSWTELFNRLEATLPGGVRITSIRPQVDRRGGTVLLLSLAARSVDDVDQFMERLDATGAFSQLLPRTERVREDGLIEATLEGLYQPDRAATAPSDAEPAAVVPERDR